MENRNKRRAGPHSERCDGTEVEKVSFDAAMLLRLLNTCPLDAENNCSLRQIARHRHFCCRQAVVCLCAATPGRLGSYEKNFIAGLGPSFTRRCNWSLSLTFPSPSGARSLKLRCIQFKKRKVVLQQFPF